MFSCKFYLITNKQLLITLIENNIVTYIISQSKYQTINFLLVTILYLIPIVAIRDDFSMISVFKTIVILL